MPIRRQNSEPPAPSCTRRRGAYVWGRSITISSQHTAYVQDKARRNGAPLESVKPFFGDLLADGGWSDHCLTTYLSRALCSSIFTFQHSFMTATTSARICVQCTNLCAGSLYFTGCPSSPTRLLYPTKPSPKALGTAAY